MTRRKPKSAKPRFSYKPSAWGTTRAVFYIFMVTIMQITWPIRILIVAIPVAAYFTYPYYEEWSVWDEVFNTQVYNMTDETVGYFKTTQFDNQVRIGAGGAGPNSMVESTSDYVSQRVITLMWSFETENHAHTQIKRASDQTCYFRTVELPQRLKGQRILLIGVYDRDVLRIRWGNNGFIPTDIGHGAFSIADAWQHGSIPLSSNWRKNDPTNWPEKTTWNEAVDGPMMDALGAGAWSTVKADLAIPCEDQQ